MSLKKELKTTLRNRGILTLNEVHSIANNLGYKESTAERTMRIICETEARALLNEKGYIKSYEWLGSEPMQPKLI